jgi:hypothetical protein
LARYPAVGRKEEQALDLVYGEFLVRQALGEEPALEEYSIDE